MNARIAFAGPCPWTPEVREALAGTFHSELGEAKIRRGVESGKLELWGVVVTLKSDNGDVARNGVLVTEVLAEQSELFVWCYQGREYFNVSRALANVACMRGLQYIGWFTFHKAAARRYRKFAPLITETGIAGEMRFRLNAEQLANGV
jgi:hypothetical protein